MGIPPGRLSHLCGEVAKLIERGPIGEPGGRDRSRALRKAPHLGDLAGHLGSGQMAAGAGFGALSALEVKCLHLLKMLEIPPETGGGKFIEVSLVVLLLFGKHAAFAGTDSGAGQLRARGQSDLGLLRERSKAHITDEQRDIQYQWLFGRRPDHCRGIDRLVLQQRQSRQLPGHQLDRLPLRQLIPGHAHGRHRSVVADVVQAVCREFVDVCDERFVGGVGRLDPAALIAVILVGHRVGALEVRHRRLIQVHVAA